MMSKSMHTRRRFLAGTAGTALALGLAGCSTGAQSEQANSPTATAEHEDEETPHDDEHDDGSHDEDDMGHDHDEGTPTEPAPNAEVELRTEGSQQHFAPHIVWIEPGGTVTWENESGTHDAVAYHPDNGDKPRRMPDGADPWAIELLSDEGATGSHTFETEGVYDYFCTPHEALGMVGTVIVGNPDPHDEVALDEPQESLPEGARTELADLGAQVREALGDDH